MSDPFGVLNLQGAPSGALATSKIVRGPQDPRALRDVLAEDEEPSAFESFFRFLGRPGFMVRTLLSGDLTGFLKNTAQFSQEFTQPWGIFNHSLLLGNQGLRAVGLHKGGDFTSAKDRPEFTDMLHAWGVVKDRSALNPWAKLGLDVAGGIVTDPLTLLGGGAGKLGTTGAKIAGASRPLARQTLLNAVKNSGDDALRSRLGQEVGEALTRVTTRTSKAPGFEALKNVQSLDDLTNMIATLPDTGPLNRTMAAKLAREVEGRAAERLFFKIYKEAGEEGVSLRRGVHGRVPDVPTEEGIARWFAGDVNTAGKELDTLLRSQTKASIFAGAPGAVPGLTTDLPHALTTLGDNGKLANQMLAQGNLQSEVLNLGQKMHVLFRPQHEVSVKKAVHTINEALANITPSSGRRVRDGLRDLGYSDEWIMPVLKRQFPAPPAGSPFPAMSFDNLPGTLDEFMKLGHDMPLSVANEGIERMIKAGMGPGGGLSLNPLWSDKIGKALERKTGWAYRNGYNYIPWADVGSATLPGMVGTLSKRMGWTGINSFERAFDDAYTTFQRGIIDRFKFGNVEGVNPKAAQAVENIARENDNTWRANVMAAQRRAYGGFDDVNVPQQFQHMIKPAYEDMTLETFKAEDVFHASAASWGAEGAKHLDELVKTIDEAIPMPPTPKGFAGALFDHDKAIKLVNSLDDEIKNAPWNFSLTRDSLWNLVEKGRVSTLKNVQVAGKTAERFLTKWDEFDRGFRKAYGHARTAYDNMEMSLWTLHSRIDRVAEWQPVREEVSKLQVNLSARKEIQNSLRTLRRLQGAAPAQEIARVRDVQQALMLRLEELAEAAKPIKNDLRRWLGTRKQGDWFKQVQELDDFVSDAEKGLSASMKRWERLQGDLRGALNKRNGDLHKTLQASARDLLSGHLTQQIVDNVAGKLPPEMRPWVEKAVNFGQTEMAKMPAFMRYHAKNGDQLLAGHVAPGPAWQQIDSANPFYIPHQATPALVEAMTNPRMPKEIRDRLMSEYDRARTLPTAKEFLVRMSEVADSLGLDHASEELVQKDYRALVLQRMLAFEKTKAMQDLYQKVAKIAGTEGGDWKAAYVNYLNGVLHPVGPRRGTFLKFFSGGKFDIPIGKAFAAGNGSDAIKFLNRSADSPTFAKIVERRGVRYMQIEWPGLNAIYKPFLTSIPTNLRFRFRNIVAAGIQASFHPEIRFQGIRPIYTALRNDGMVRWAIRHFNKKFNSNVREWSTDAGGTLRTLGYKQAPSGASMLASMTPEQRMSWAASTVVRATTAPSAAERMIARGALSKLNDRVGKYSWEEALDILDQVLARKKVQTDLAQGVEDMTEFFSALNRPTHNDPNALGKIVRGLRKFVDFGMSISEEQETQFRAMTALNLMKKGKSPVEVVMEVNRLQVDYSLQSEVEQAVRAVVPFARYMIGSVGWVQDMLQNPSGWGKGPVGHLASIQNLGHMQRSLSGTGEGESTFLPRHAKESLAMPLPWKDLEGNREFLTSLGFPQEVVINMLSLIGGRRETVMHQAGGIHPVLKAPLEFFTNRNFFFGTEWGEYRKSPFLMRPFAQEVPGPNGTTRHEVPGAVNELINASPLSGLESTVNRLTDERQPIGLRLLNALTGFRIQGVDEESELQKRIAEFLKKRVKSGEVGELEVFFSRLKPEDVPEEVKKVLEALEQSRAERRRANRNKEGS